MDIISFSHTTGEVKMENTGNKVAKAALVVSGPLVTWSIEPIFGVMFAGTELVVCVAYCVWAKRRDSDGGLEDVEYYKKKK